MSIEKYQDLIENTVDSIAILQRHEIKVVNAQFLKMFGCRHKKEMVDLPFTEFVAPEHRELINRMCLDAKEGEEFPYHWEFKALRCDGKTFDAELFTNLVEFQGEIVRQAIIKDISNEVIAEKARRKAGENLNYRLQLKIKDLEKTIKKKEETNHALKVLLEKKEETNHALKVLLEKKERDQKEIQESVLLNLNKLILPYIEKIKMTDLDDFQKTFLSIIETNLKDIVSPFSRKMSVKEFNLTPRELQVANLIKRGISSKIIAKVMNISPKTVDTYRKNIRKKIGLERKRVNLRSYLLSLNLPDI